MGIEIKKVRRREELSKGDWVNVIVKYGPDGTMVKRKKGRVVDVLRKAAILRDIEGEKKGTRTVPFGELELRVEVPDAPPAPPKKRRTSRKKPAEPVVTPAPVVSPPKSVPPPTMSDWIANGVKLQEQLIEQAHTIENEVSVLRARQQELEDEALRVADQANSKQRDLDGVREQIAAMDTLRGKVVG